jgi:hypothetical protein
MSRDARLDIVRGYAMITIAINHIGDLFGKLGMTGRPIPTLTQYGFSSAAELFVALSGYMVGMVYLRRPAIWRIASARAFKIYQYNFVAFMLSSMIAIGSGPLLSLATGTDYLVRNPAEGAMKFAFLSYHPHLLGVLQLYVLLMLVLAGTARLSPSSGWVFAPLSLALYIVVQLDESFNLPGGTPGDDGCWNFNPLAWQLLFFLGVLAGKYRLHQKIIAWLESRAAIPVAVIALFGVVTIARHVGRMVGYDFPMDDKETLGPLRIAHMMLVVAFLFSLLTIFRSHLDSSMARLVGLIGCHTLECYVVSVVATYGVAAIWLRFDHSYPGYFLSVFATLGLVLVAAIVARGRKRATIRGSATQPVPG